MSKLKKLKKTKRIEVANASEVARRIAQLNK